MRIEVYLKREKYTLAFN